MPLTADESGRAPWRVPLSGELAGRYLRLAVTGARREYPNVPMHMLTGPADLRLPREIHPAFYGCLDWHSAVHTHWMMARVCRLLPDAPGVAEARAVLNDHLSAANLAVEAAYLTQPARTSFERPYGRAWALVLAAELRRWADESGDPDVAGWAASAEPLAAVVAEGFCSWLPRLGYPIRTGVHPNSAFALTLVLDAVPHLRGGQAGELGRLARSVATAWFGGDEHYDARFEPSGGDFLSPALVEAALMARVLPADRFAVWLTAFAPGLADRRPANLFTPVAVTDRADPHGVHLDGLNLSRAWCWGRLAETLPAVDPRSAVAAAAARRHLDAALPYVTTGDFMGEHWLATFAVLALT